MLARLFFINTAEYALNRLIALDPDAPVCLSPIAGKIIAINLNPPGWRFTVCPTNRGIQFIENFAGSPDAILTGSAWAFGLATQSKSSPLRAIIANNVTLDGDVETGRAFQALFDKLDIDWEEQLSRFTGDIAAHKIGNIFRAGKNWGVESLDTFKLNLTEFLQEEARVIPTKIEANHFPEDVEKLREDCDRLQDRISHLQKSLG